jgi:hypothetical protein
MTIRPLAICLYSTGLFAITALAQNPGVAQNQVGALGESLARNQAALKSYTWVETTEISLNGEVRKREQKNCRYGPDGKVEKTPFPGSPPPESAGGGRRGGAIRRAIVEKKVEELKDYMERVGALVRQYVPPDPQKIQAAQQAGNISVQLPGSQANTTLTVANYLKSGDSVAIGFDPAASQVRSYNVHSYLDNPRDDAVTLAVTFASLPDGTNYAQQTVLDAPGKKIRVTITNSEYTKAAQ